MPICILGNRNIRSPFSSSLIKSQELAISYFLLARLKDSLNRFGSRKMEQEAGTYLNPLPYPGSQCCPGQQTACREDEDEYNSFILPRVSLCKFFVAVSLQYTAEQPL